MKKKACKHPPEKVKAGPRIPARWGSWETEVCDCGSWRQMTHVIDPWHKPPFPKIDQHVDDDV